MSRILVLSPFPPPPDGIGSHSMRLVDAWAHAGHEVLVMSQGSERTLEAHEGYAVARILGPRSFARAQRAAVEFRPDLVFCQFAVSALTTSTAAVMKICRAMEAEGVPVAMAFHEPLREIALLGPLGRWIYAKALGSCSAPITFSIGATNALGFAHPPREITQLAHGIPALPTPTLHDIERVRAAYGLSGTFILDFGFIHPDKGVDVLVAAAPMVARLHGGPVNLLIAGRPRRRSSIFKLLGMVDERHYAALRKAAADLPSDVRSSFPSYLPDEDLAPLLASASVVVLPYRRTTQSGVASFVLAAGSPAVVTRLPGLEGAFGDAAVYAEPGDPASLATAINEVLGDEALQDRLRDRARQRAAREGYDQVARQILEAGLGNSELRSSS